MMVLGHLGIPLALSPFLSKHGIDHRLLLVGCMLPDLIDKPLGHLVFPQDNGRMFAHTLLFGTMLILMGLASRRFLALALGDLMHLLMDNAFTEPRTALWPLFGPFPYGDFEVYRWLEAFTDPYVIATEVLGSIIIAYVLYGSKIWKRAGLRAFLKRGVLLGDAP